MGVTAISCSEDALSAEEAEGAMEIKPILKLIVVLAGLLPWAAAPLAGFSESDCDVLFGDALDRTVTWHHRSDISSPAGKPIRLRMFLSEADLYSPKFSE